MFLPFAVVVWLPALGVVAGQSQTCAEEDSQGYGNEKTNREEDHDQETAALLHLKSGKSGTMGGPVMPSTCERSNVSVYLDHLEHGGDDCWWACGERGGFCEYCGGHLCCAPNGESDTGCHQEICAQTSDWDTNNPFSRRRHHFCGRFEPTAPNLTSEEALIELPQVTTQTDESARQTRFRLLSALKGRHFTGAIASLVRWFDFIPAVNGYVAQFRLPIGDYQAKSCDLTGILAILGQASHLDMVGAGYSYYIAKSSPRHPSVNMGGCKCISYSNDTLTACAGDVLAEAIPVLESAGKMLISHGEYHYLSFGGMIATFNHGSSDSNNSIVDGINWMEFYDLSSKTFRMLSNLTLIKQVIASRSFIMTRANFRTVPDEYVITVTRQIRGKEVMDQDFLQSLDTVQFVSAVQRFQTDGSYVMEVFGASPLATAQLQVLYKKSFSPHVCAQDYRECRFVDFFLGGDDADDSEGIFGYSFDLNGHVVKSIVVQAWWDVKDAFGTRFFGAHFPSLVANARSYQFELCVRGYNLTAMINFYHTSYQGWAEDQRLKHAANFRRGRCDSSDSLECWTWIEIDILGQYHEAVLLWNRVIGLFNNTETYVHRGKERLGEGPANEVLHV
ncbi:unnamed protein product [Symbiodinium sp. CCMP2592]|nr:unnamed protein product [Symbiodinium sp. CCMP2592]